MSHDAGFHACFQVGDHSRDRPVSSAFIESLIDQGVDMLAEVYYQVMRIFDVRHPRLVALGNAILQTSILCCELVRVCLARHLASLHLRLHVCHLICAPHVFLAAGCCSGA